MSPFFLYNAYIQFSNQHELYTGIIHVQSQSQPGSPFFSHTILHGIFMCSPAGPVEKSLSIVVPDIRITVSFSHQISHQIQMTIPAVFEKTNTCSNHTVFTNTDMNVKRASYPGSFGEEKTFFLLVVILYSELYSLIASAYALGKRLEVKHRNWIRGSPLKKLPTRL